MKKQFDWVPFYKEFAYVLLDYKNQRSELIKKINRVFESIETKLPTLETENKLVDIDPFTVYGLFNKSSMKEDNRIKIVAAFAREFEMKVPIPTSFDSIPVLNNQNATFYNFIAERGIDDIDELWDLLDFALKYAKNNTTENLEQVSKYFDLAIGKKGNGNSKITMALYWIDPNFYLNLDQHNIWYIYSSGYLPEEVVSSLPIIKPKIESKKYFDIVSKLWKILNSDILPLKDFKELSHVAWVTSVEYNEKNKKQPKTARDEKGSGLADEDVDMVHYWLYSPGDGSYMWEEFHREGVMGIRWSEIGDLSQYSSKDEMKLAMKEHIDPSLPYTIAAHTTWQFANEMKPGDIIFVKRGWRQVIGRGVVTSDYYFNPSIDEKFSHLRQVEWTDNCVDDPKDHPGKAAAKSLTDITPYTDYVEKLKSLFETDDDLEEETPEISYPRYDSEKFLAEVYVDKDTYHNLVGLLRAKKNIILQGPPGVGKTYMAKRLAYSMMGAKQQDRVMMVQFHQSYSYEDFIEGFRPAAGSDGFEIKKGSFYNFCKRAEENQDHEYFFIIDEINRGNLSKIFGELFMLIENDKRGNSLQLLYSDEKFSVPNNVYIIGMMNTADRSLAMLDYALRRRFAFFEMKPGLDSDGFNYYRQSLQNQEFDFLINRVMELNQAISSDDSLGADFCIGHSYFCGFEAVSYSDLSNIVNYELIPLLKEYWFDDPIKVKNWASTLRSAIK